MSMFDSYCQRVHENDRRAMDSWDYAEPEDDWEEEDDWEDEVDDEPLKELTPEQVERINKNLQKTLEDGKKKGEEIWKQMITKNLQTANCRAWWTF